MLDWLHSMLGWLKQRLSSQSKAEGGELLSKERYPIAKMALFAAFDLSESVAEMTKPISAGATEIRLTLQ